MGSKIKKIINNNKINKNKNKKLNKNKIKKTYSNKNKIIQYK